MFPISIVPIVKVCNDIKPIEEFMVNCFFLDPAKMAEAMAEAEMNNQKNALT